MKTRRRRIRTLGSSGRDHEKSAMSHYHSAEQLADHARKATGCKSVSEYLHAAALQFGQGLAHEQSGGGSPAVAARKNDASMSIRDAQRGLGKCLR